MSRNTLLWFHGLGAAMIGGGSGAVASGFSVNLIDPKDWNMTDMPHAQHLLLLMAMVFIVNGALATFAWLSKSPLPPLDDATAAVVNQQAAVIQQSAQVIKDATK